MRRVKALLVNAAMAASLSLAIAGTGRASEAETQGGPTLRLMTEHRPPNNFRDPEDGEVTGAHAELIRELIARLGWRARFELEVWSRSYALALSEADTCVFSAVRAEFREAQFKWVGPIGYSSFALVGLPGRDYGIERLEDARGLTIGVYTRDVRETLLQRLGGFMIDSAAADELNARKLQAGRIDLWFTDLETLELLRARGAGPFQLVLLQDGEALYLACNLQLDDAAVAAMNAELEAMRRDGAARAILARDWGGAEIETSRTPP